LRLITSNDTGGGSNELVIVHNSDVAAKVKAVDTMTRVNSMRAKRRTKRMALKRSTFSVRPAIYLYEI
jgi:hypothetical protein